MPLFDIVLIFIKINMLEFFSIYALDNIRSNLQDANDNA